MERRGFLGVIGGMPLGHNRKDTSADTRSKRLLIVYHVFYYSDEQVHSLVDCLEAIGIQAIALACDAHEDIRLFDLDGLSDSEYGQIRQMVADALKSTHGTP